MDPVTHRSWKFPGLKPVVRKIDPRGLFANGLLVSRDIVRRNVVLSWVVLVSSNAAPIKAVIKFSRRRSRNANLLSIQRRGTSHQQDINYLHRTIVRRAFHLPNWRPDPLLYSKHVRYEKESYWKRSNERGPAQSAHPRWRLCDSWPHHR